MKKQLSTALIIMVGIFISQNAYCQIETEKIEFISEGNRLNAELFFPLLDTVSPAIVLMHGYPGGEGDPLGLAKKLSALGIIAFVFNYQGTWSSEGDFNFENSMIDARNAVRLLKQKNIAEKFKIDTSNIVIGGYSFGGAMALAGAIYYSEIQRIIAIGGPNEAVYARKMLANKSVYNMFLNMFKSFEYPDGPIKVNSELWINNFLNDYQKLDLILHSDSLKNKDILLIGGWDDQNVLLEEHQIPLYRKLNAIGASRIKLLAFKTDHSFNGVKNNMAQEIYDWIFEKN
ncbi:MAG: prolyl oligopeptidase family serine peptidase [Ignavibacteriae bacterium]|jgi:dipeptidyl aminopeptidase/acylaminoacyl peptidase|nr:hypothetical protein [Ignavibacteriota bacterium]NOG98928.1 prolyl oligopeptidase family serine peptidase [Ignavibacteriota bacterium]